MRPGYIDSLCIAHLTFAHTRHDSSAGDQEWLVIWLIQIWQTTLRSSSALSSPRRGARRTPSTASVDGVREPLSISNLEQSVSCVLVGPRREGCVARTPASAVTAAAARLASTHNLHSILRDRLK